MSHLNIFTLLVFDKQNGVRETAEWRYSKNCVDTYT